MRIGSLSRSSFMWCLSFACKEFMILAFVFSSPHTSPYFWSFACCLWLWSCMCYLNIMLVRKRIGLCAHPFPPSQHKQTKIKNEKKTKRQEITGKNLCMNAYM